MGEHRGRPKLQPTEIYYIDSLPQIGKTEWAIKKMIEYSKQGDGVMIYTCNSAQQLREIYHRLIEEENVPKVKVSLIDTDPNTGYQCEDRFVEERVYATMRQKNPNYESSDGYTRSVLFPGSLVLMHNNAFWYTHLHWVFNQDTFPRKDQITVIIDDAQEFPVTKANFVVEGKENIDLFLNAANIKSISKYTEKLDYYFLNSFTARELRQVEEQLLKNEKLLREYSHEYLIPPFWTDGYFFDYPIVLKATQYQSTKYGSSYADTSLYFEACFSPLELLHKWKKVWLVGSFLKSSLFFHTCNSPYNKKKRPKQYNPIEMVDVTPWCVDEKVVQEKSEWFKNHITIANIGVEDVSEECIDGVVGVVR